MAVEDNERKQTSMAARFRTNRLKSVAYHRWLTTARAMAMKRALDEKETERKVQLHDVIATHNVEVEGLREQNASLLKWKEAETAAKKKVMEKMRSIYLMQQQQQQFELMMSFSEGDGADAAAAAQLEQAR